VRAFSGAHFIEQGHGAFVKKARADAAEHIVRRLALQNDAVDFVDAKQLPEQQSRRPRADDCYFCPQYLLPRLL
jgi:hypothetical protein